MTVLTTGANGIVGSAVIARLSKEGFDVVGLVRKTSDLSRLETVPHNLRYGDLTDLPSLTRAMSGCEAIVHCAARSSDWGSKHDFHSVNVLGVRNILEAAQLSGVKKIVHISSLNAAGYGVRNMTESMETQNMTEYSRSKREGEKIILNGGKNHGVGVTVLRPGAVYGPGDWKFSLIMFSIIKQGLCPVINGGKGVFTPVYIKNLTAAVSAALNKPADYKIYNITDDVTVNWIEFFKLFASAIGIPLKIVNIPYPLAITAAVLSEGLTKLLHRGTAPKITKYMVIRATRDFHYSCEKAKTEFGYSPDTDITAHIRETVAWCRQNQTPGYLKTVRSRT